MMTVTRRVENTVQAQLRSRKRAMMTMTTKLRAKQQATLGKTAKEKEAATQREWPMRRVT
eukprot:5233868-Pleurochrysis_carterae.AAC.1